MPSAGDAPPILDFSSMTFFSFMHLQDTDGA